MSEEKLRVSDYLGCPWGDIPERKVEEVEGKEVAIGPYELREGGFGVEAHILCHDGDDEFCVRTTSTVVINQLARIADKLPLLGSFHREKNYHLIR